MSHIPVWNTLTTVPLRRLCLRAHIEPPGNEEEGVKKESPIVSEYGSKRIIFDLLSLLGAAFAQSAVVVPHLVLGIVL